MRDFKRSNMSGRYRVRSESYGLVTERRHDISVLCAISHLLHIHGLCNITPFIVECGIARFLGCVAQWAERRSLAGELTLSCARPAADG